MENFLYVGIDLAQNKTGVAFLLKPSNALIVKTIETNKFHPNNFESNVSIFENEIKNFIVQKNMIYKEIYIGIELSNFGNPSFTNKVHFYAGALYVMLKKYNPFAKFKFYNANIWFQHLLNETGNLTQINNLSTELRKKISWDFATKKWPLANFKTPDEADAACIAHFYDLCSNTIEIIEFNKTAKKSAKEKVVSKKKRLLKLKEKEIALKAKISDYECKSKLKTLTKPQVNKLNNLKIELAQIQGEINEISTKY